MVEVGHATLTDVNEQLLWQNDQRYRAYFYDLIMGHGTAEEEEVEISISNGLPPRNQFLSNEVSMKCVYLQHITPGRLSIEQGTAFEYITRSRLYNTSRFDEAQRNLQGPNHGRRGQHEQQIPLTL